MPNSELESFAVLLKKYRLAATLTQEELAEKAGISSRGISDLERGVHRTPYKGTLELLADALQLSEEDRLLFKKAAFRKPVDTEQSLTKPNLSISNQLPLFGREQELQWVLNRLAGKETPVMMLTGEPGIGKTRLLNEVVTQARNRGWTVLEGSCTGRGGQSPYAPLLEALAGRLSQQTPSQLEAELKDCEWLIRLLPELREVIPPLTLEWQQFTPEQERRLVFAAVARYLTNIAGSAGTLLVLDDLQWAGRDALDLIIALVHSSRATPLRIIGAYRSTEANFGDSLSTSIADLARQGLVGQLELEPLENQAATELINLLLHNLPTETQANLTSQLLARTNGNPFFLISCIRGLQSSTADGSSSENALPWDVKQTIRQRVAALPEVAQELLGIAAVIGRAIQAEILLAVAATTWSKREILVPLEAACRARLLLEIEIGGEPGYRFAHGLVREVIEADLSALRHRFLHSEVAAVLEQNLASTTPQILVHHYRQARDLKNALRHLLRAIDYARQVAAQREETELLAEAIEYATRTGQSRFGLELRVARGKVCAALAMWEEADRELTTVLSNLAEIPVETQAELLVTLAEVRHYRLDMVAIRSYATQASEIAEQLGRNDLVARAFSALAIGESSAGDIEASLTNFEAAYKRAGKQYLPQLASGLELNGLTYYWLGRYDAAITILRQALEMSRQTYNTTIVARCLGSLGLALAGKAYYPEAFKVFEEGCQFAEDNTMPHWKARTVAMHGGIFLDLFIYNRAEELALEARKLSQALNWPLAETSAGIDLLFNYVRSGRLAQAEVLVAEVANAVEAGQGAHGWLWKLRFLAAEAELDLVKGVGDKALEKAEAVIKESRQLKRLKYEVLGLQIRGEALVKLGDMVRAKADLEKAVALARASTNPAMFLQASFKLLGYFKDAALSIEAQSAVPLTAAKLEDKELAHRFLASDEIVSITKAA